MRKIKIVLFIAFVFALANFAAMQTAHATTNVAAPDATQPGPNFVVNTNADTDDGRCDLAGQGTGNKDCTLREAINAANANADVSVITFAASYTITLTSALPDIATALTIAGKGAANTIVQASKCNPVTLPKGCTPADWRVFTFTAGTSALKDMTVRNGNCDADNTCSSADPDYGGNIYAGTLSTGLTLDAVHVHRGFADGYGGGITIQGGNLTVQNNSLIGGSGAGNQSGSGNDGGGIYQTNAGDLTIDNSIVSYNEAGGYSGGVHFEDSGSVTIRNGSLIDHNISHDNGGGMYAFNCNGQFNIDASTISNNFEDGSDGGGLWTGCTTTINNSTISGNTAEDHDGGGIYIFSAGNATITNSTITDNHAAQNTDTGINGGGIFNGGTLTVVNSTFYNNDAANYGGGIYNASGATATLLNNTISDSTGDSYEGIYNAGTLHLSNNIIANSVESDCVNDGGTIATAINNLIEHNGTSGFACGTPVSIADPMLGPLQDNGGPTQTMALLAGSPAIDAGDDTVCADVNTVNNQDQRGVTRPFGAHCDIGAYEMDRFVVTIASNKTEDGQILESAENSSQGGSKSSKSNTMFLGDDALNRQYRDILSFDTTLPNGAVITKLTLKFKKAGAFVGGQNPVALLGGFMVDVKKGNFNKPSLQLTDFQAKQSKTVGAFKPKPLGEWYSINLTKAKNFINPLGNTQMRLRFAQDDNNNLTANYLKLYSGDADAASAPQLIIEYAAP